MEENTQNMPVEESQVPDLPQEQQEQPQQAAPEPTACSRMLKIWLGLLTFIFTVSMLSGLYIIFNGVPPAREVVEETAPSQSRISSLLRINQRADEGVAVVRIRGVIQEGAESGFSAAQSASSVARRIRRLADRKEIKALLLDVNSPGGTVAAVQEIHDAVLYFKSQGKPVVALFRDVAASGGFYVAMGADKIIAQQGTMTGSIGVIMQAANFEGLLEKVGVKFIPIKSGKHKDIGAFYRPMTEEEVALLQEMIGETYQQFYQAVKAGRPNIDDATLSVYADGRVFTGARAKTLGFVDDLGGEDKAREYLSDLTKIKDIKLLTPRVENFFDMLAVSASGLDGKLSMARVEELATPRVAYLWTL